LVAEETKIIPDFYFQTAVTFLESLLAASPFQMINLQGPAQGISTGANRDQYILLKSGADLATNFMRQKKAKSRIKPGKSSNVLTNANSHADNPQFPTESNQARVWSVLCLPNRVIVIQPSMALCVNHPRYE
jgi:hypothetical protein